MWHRDDLRVGSHVAGPLAVALCLSVLLLPQLASTAHAQPAQPGMPGTYQHMEYGPVIAQSIEAPWPEDNHAMKGLAVRLDHDLAMTFDTDLLRFSAGTTDGWIDILDTDFAAIKGHSTAFTEGELIFATAPETPGWAHPETGSFADTRPLELGNLPRDHGRYRGYYRHGDRVVLSYRVGDTDVLELPQGVKVDDRPAFVRRMHVGSSDADHTVLLTSSDQVERIELIDGRAALVESERGNLAIILHGSTDAAELAGQSEDDLTHILLRIEARDEPAALDVAIVALGDDVSADAVAALADDLPLDEIDIPALTEGGPAQYDQTITVSGSLGDEDWAYALDNITLPFNNPWNARLRLMGFDFFEGGESAAITTINGDVWIVEGIDDNLQQLHWRRFATGMYKPGGIAIRDGEIFVTERSQLTRLHDLNGNGEADFYENFNNDHHVHRRAHALTLETDSEGNFYFFKNGNRVPADVPHHGALIRVSADGSEREVFAHGFRGNNGLHITDDDLILTGDQEGGWVPATRIDIVEQGKFYGFRPHGGEDYEIGEYELPICWIPHTVDNSAGGAALAPDDGRFGPLSGHWLHTSYGQAKLYVLMYEQVDGVQQGGVVELPLNFESGIMRAQFNDRDGQLYIAGMRGWQTVSFRDGAFYRVRYTGGPANLPVAVHAHEDGVTVRFTDPLDPETAGDLDSYTAKRWTYLYTAEYGSPEVSLLETAPENLATARNRADDYTTGRDDVPIEAVTLSDDGRQVFLRIDDMHPVKQMMIGYELNADDGTELDNAVYHTIHRLSPDMAPAASR